MLRVTLPPSLYLHPFLHLSLSLPLFLPLSLSLSLSIAPLSLHLFPSFSLSIAPLSSSTLLCTHTQTRWGVIQTDCSHELHTTNSPGITVCMCVCVCVCVSNLSLLMCHGTSMVLTGPALHHPPHHHHVRSPPVNSSRRQPITSFPTSLPVLSHTCKD